MKKLLVLLLAAIMVFSVFACSKKDGDKPADDTTKPGVTDGLTGETTPDITTKDPNVPDIPELTFGGAEYRVATRDGSIRDEVYADETSIDIRSTALQMRNAKIEDTYDVIIDPLVFTDNTLYGVSDALIEYIFSEDDVYDLGLTYANGTGNLVSGGFVVNWFNLKYNDFSKKYWINDVNSKLVIEDSVYSVVGDMSITTLLLTYAMFYNRTEGTQIMMDSGNNMTEEIFEKVANHEWTLDYFTELVGNVYQDIDDTAGVSDGDFYGFNTGLLTDLDVWPFAFDVEIIVPDEELGIKSVLNSERTHTMVDKLYNLIWESNGTINSKGGKFKLGELLFHTTILGNCFGSFKDMEDQYTILPYPMLDENQEKYMTGAMDNYSVMTIPRTCSNLDMVSYITEVMNYESREQIYPVYYEESLQKQYTRDPESIEMLDIIMDGRNFDLSTIFPDDTEGICFFIRWTVGNKNKDFQGFYDKREEKVNSAIATLVQTYRENKNAGE